MPKAKRPKICIDRILPWNMMKPQRTYREAGRTKAIQPFPLRTWPNGTILHVKFMEGTASQKAKVKEQARWWEEVANLKFVFDDAVDAEIRIAFDESDGAWSYVGTDCRSIPSSAPTMNLGFLDGGTVAHEFGHAIGLLHEHQNPEGGIEWNEEEVIKEVSGPPNYWSEEEIRHNILNKYEVDQVRGTRFDPDSIMLYAFPSSWTMDGFGTKANDVLSETDKEYVGMTMYPKSVVPKVVKLTVNAKRRTSASIGALGEEDLYQFTADKDGRYIIDTRGPTDLVMRLYGPDDKTALIAEDDDSGIDANAKISVDLIPGDYYVQVRHYNREGGTGKYTIKVRRT